jgi:hypothetical protein
VTPRITFVGNDAFNMNGVNFGTRDVSISFPSSLTSMGQRCFGNTNCHNITFNSPVLGQYLLQNSTVNNIIVRSTQSIPCIFAVGSWALDNTVTANTLELYDYCQVGSLGATLTNLIFHNNCQTTSGCSLANLQTVTAGDDLTVSSDVFSSTNTITSITIGKRFTTNYTGTVINGQTNITTTVEQPSIQAHLAIVRSHCRLPFERL